MVLEFVTLDGVIQAPGGQARSLGAASGESTGRAPVMRQYVLARAASEVPLDMPASSVDLPQWLFGLSDLEYQECAKGHLGAGVGRLPNGKRTSVNVESVGGHLAVQHYVELDSSAGHLRLVSERSDVWIFRLIHIQPRVTWEMTIVPTSEQACTFQHRVSLEHSSVLIKVASVLCLVPFFVRRHDREESKLFAASLARKSKGGPAVHCKGTAPSLDVGTSRGTAVGHAPTVGASRRGFKRFSTFLTDQQERERGP